jgi:3-methyl-2-oxobutanoate hydroxymethyltransferase
MKSVLELREAKRRGQKIAMLTCYDSTSAALVAQAGVDLILVGDSVAMTMHGHDDTLAADVDLMALHIAAVDRGLRQLSSVSLSSTQTSRWTRPMIVGDLPFLAHRMGREALMNAAARLMRAGAQILKVEGIDGSEDDLRYLIQSGVPVMGHIGLTPQSVHALGGWRVQGRDARAAEALLRQARALQECGVSALVLECVPAPLASQISQELEIPTIGIGAGAGCDGQVLVFQDVLGLQSHFKPKFVRRYLQGAEILTDALRRYVDDVRSQAFPAPDESFDLPARSPEAQA